MFLPPLTSRGRCQHPAWRLNCGSDYWVYKKRYWVGPRPAAAAADRLSSHYLCSFLNLGSLRSSGQQGAVQWRCTVLYCTVLCTTLGHRAKLTENCQSAPDLRPPAVLPPTEGEEEAEAVVEAGGRLSRAESSPSPGMDALPSFILSCPYDQDSPWGTRLEIPT